MHTFLCFMQASLMVIERKEWEHETNYVASLRSPMAIAASRKGRQTISDRFRSDINYSANLEIEFVLKF